jgi:ABC-type spermidine/putrescine transport system permease subunit I
MRRHTESPAAGPRDGSLTPPAVRAAPPRRGRWLPFLLLGPAALWNLAFFIVPVGVMVRRSFDAGGFSLAHYEKLFTSPLYVAVMLTTFETSVLVTTGCLVLGYPVAYLLATSGPRARAVMLLLVIVPYWLDYIVRSYSWMVLLGRMGLVNRALLGLGVITEPLAILYTRWSVAIGMVQILLPLMVLTLYGAMLRIDQSLMHAAAAHGARPWQSFRRIFFPLSLPGVYGACLLTFVTALGFYITPALLGGRKDTMISQLIVTVSSDMLDWSLASALSVVLLLASLVIVAVYNRFFSIDRLWGGSV